MQRSKRVHRRKILTFGHFVLCIFDNTHKRGQIQVNGHSSILDGARKLLGWWMRKALK
jgi:hypothetical protein